MSRMWGIYVDKFLVPFARFSMFMVTLNVCIQAAYLVVTEVFLASWLNKNLDQSFSLRWATVITWYYLEMPSFVGFLSQGDSQIATVASFHSVSSHHWNVDGSNTAISTYQVTNKHWSTLLSCNDWPGNRTQDLLLSFLLLISITKSPPCLPISQPMAWHHLSRYISKATPPTTN